MHVKIGRQWSENEPRQVRQSGMDNLSTGAWPSSDEPSLFGFQLAEPGHRPMQMAPQEDREVNTALQETLANPGLQGVE